MKVYVLCLATDEIFTRGLEERLREKGNAVRIDAVEHFPIADSLSAKLESAAATHDFVVAVLRDDGGRERWLENELAIQSRIEASHLGARVEDVPCRFAVLGGTRANETARLATFERSDVEGILAFVGAGAVLPNPVLTPAPEGDVIVKQFMLLEPVHVEDTLPTTRALLREQLATLEGDEGVAVLQHLATPPTRTGRG